MYSSAKEINQYSYNVKGQLEQKSSKYFNYPWVTTNYEYDDNGKLKKEESYDTRLDNKYSVQYFYQNEKLKMKIVDNDGQIDTLRVK
jgi:YD repeat-containing protein